MRNPHLKDIERLIIHDESFREGIVPMEDLNMDVRRALHDLSPEEARKMKRKFRKKWKKAKKRALREATSKGAEKFKKRLDEIFGEPGKVPTRGQKLERKRYVSHEIAITVRERVDNLLSKESKK